jgi:hypothetical protein
MRRSREARLGVLAAIALALLPAALAVLIHDGRAARASAVKRSGQTARPRPVPPPTQPKVDLGPKDIAKDVERLRGLQFSKLPPVEIVGPARVQKVQKRQASRIKRRLHGTSAKLKKLQSESQSSIELLKLAGIVAPSFSTQQTVKSLLGSVAGEFDPSSRTVKVLETPGEADEQRATVVAHELDHSLDNSHFPDAFKAAGNTTASERQLAASALVEGTATVVAARFDAEHGYQAAVAGGALLSAQNAGFGVPPVLAAQFRFPYTSGAKFVQTLYDRANGWRLVNRAFRHPPTTTAQILDPALWIHHVGSAHVMLDPALGRPLNQTYKSTSGQLDDELILALAVPAQTARSASRGWDGGAVAVWQRPEGKGCAAPCRKDNAAVLADRWSSVGSAARFMAQLPTYLAVRLGAKPQTPGVFRVGDGFAAISLQGQGTAMSFAPSAAQATQIAVGAARSADRAR